MAANDNADSLLGNEVVLTTMQGIIRGMREANHASGEGGADRPVSSQDIINALSLTIAALLELDPGYKTPRDMRTAGELVGSNVTLLLRGVRENYEKTGKHMAEAFIAPHMAQ